MKRLVLLLFVTLLCSTIGATRYIVYEVQGMVKFSERTSRMQLKKKNIVTEKTILVIPEGGSVVLLDPDKKSKITITKSGTNTVQQFLCQTSTVSEITKPKYWKSLLTSLIKNEEGGSRIGTHEGVIDRSLFGCDSTQAEVDSVQTIKE